MYVLLERLGKVRDQGHHTGRQGRVDELINDDVNNQGGATDKGVLGMKGCWC